jgi:hypothetical protein
MPETAKQEPVPALELKLLTPLGTYPTLAETEALLYSMELISSLLVW